MRFLRTGQVAACAALSNVLYIHLPLKGYGYSRTGYLCKILDKCNKWQWKMHLKFVRFPAYFFQVVVKSAKCKK